MMPSCRNASYHKSLIYIRFHTNCLTFKEDFAVVAVPTKIAGNKRCDLHDGHVHRTTDGAIPVQSPCPFSLSFHFTHLTCFFLSFT